MDKLLTTEEVMNLLRISRPSLRRLRESGRLPFTEIGPRSYRYRRIDIDRLFDIDHQSKKDVDLSVS